jgi:hypothetical protein
MRKDKAKPQEVSKEEKAVAKKMISSDISRDIQMNLQEWEALQKLMGDRGAIINSRGGEVTVEKSG